MQVASIIIIALLKNRFVQEDKNTYIAHETSYKFIIHYIFFCCGEWGI